MRDTNLNQIRFHFGEKGIEFIVEVSDSETHL